MKFDKDALRQKFKKFWDSPSALPVTLPLKRIALFTTTPAANFVACLKEVLRDDDDSSFVARFITECDNEGVTSAKGYTSVIAWGGMIVGGIGAAVGGWFGVGALGLGHICMGIAAVALTGVGVVAGPLVVAALATLGGFIVGCGVAAPGVVDGFRRAKQYTREKNLQAAGTQAVPQLNDAPPDMRKTAGDILEKVAAMPENCRGPFLKALNEKYAATGGDDTDRILKSIEALPDAGREEIALKLRDMLAGSFEVVAKKEMGDTVVVKKAAMQGGPLKFKPQNQGSSAA